jgi:ketosteroid isomerase-like protein
VFERRSEAIRAKDLERLLAFYSPDVVYFDVVPPLQYVGSAALRGRFTHWFEGFDGPIGQELSDLTVTADGDVAVGSMLIRASGTLMNGHEVSQWVRATSVCRRSESGWLITHEHVSLPVDLDTGTAARDLVLTGRDEVDPASAARTCSNWQAPVNDHSSGGILTAERGSHPIERVEGTSLAPR